MLHYTTTMKNTGTMKFITSFIIALWLAITPVSSYAQTPGTDEITQIFTTLDPEKTNQIIYAVFNNAPDEFKPILIPAINLKEKLDNLGIKNTTTLVTTLLTPQSLLSDNSKLDEVEAILREVLPPEYLPILDHASNVRQKVLALSQKHPEKVQTIQALTQSTMSKMDQLQNAKTSTMNFIAKMRAIKDEIAAWWNEISSWFE